VCWHRNVIPLRDSGDEVAAKDNEAIGIDRAFLWRGRGGAQ
jgi:hypothetical protein